MEIDLKRQCRDFYRSLTWRRMARDRVGVAVLRLWAPVWRAVREIYYQLDLQGRWLKAHGLAVGLAKQVLRINPRVVGGSVGGILVIAGLVMVVSKSSQTSQDSANASSLPQIPQIAPTVAIEPAAPTSQPELVPVVEAPPLNPEEQFAQAKQKCLDRLYATEAYLAAKDQADRLEERLKILRKVDPERQLPAASLEWMEAKNVIARMVSAALAEDTDVRRTEQVLLDQGMMRRGKRIYVFESGLDRAKMPSEPTVRSEDQPIGP